MPQKGKSANVGSQPGCKVLSWELQVDSWCMSVYVVVSLFSMSGFQKIGSAVSYSWPPGSAPRSLEFQTTGSLTLWISLVYCLCDMKAMKVSARTKASNNSEVKLIAASATSRHQKPMEILKISQNTQYRSTSKFSSKHLKTFETTNLNVGDSMVSQCFSYSWCCWTKLLLPVGHRRPLFWVIAALHL